MEELQPTAETQFALAWSEREWGAKAARKLRNAKARELRKEGFEVKTETVDFTDLLRDRVVMLEAHRPGTPKFPFGCDVAYQKNGE